VKAGVSKALAVGALVAVTGTAFLVAFTFFKKGGYSKSESYLAHALFTDATGLTWKSRVQIAGIQVGEVETIALEGDKALLTFRIKNDVLLHDDACLYKTFPSALLPDALLEVTPGTSGRPILKDLPVERREITCIREATSVQQLLDSMSKIAADVQVVTGDLAETVRGNHGSLRNIIENLAATTDRLKTLLEENDQNVSSILRNTRDFTRDLRDISGRDKERVHDILVNVEALTRELRTSAASLQTILAGVKPPGAPGGSGPSAEGGGAAPGTAGSLAVSPDGSGGPSVPPSPGGAAAGAAPTPEQAQAQAQAKGVQQAVEKLNDNLAKLDEILETVREGKSTAGKLLVDERMGRQVGGAVEGISDYVDRLSRLQIQMHLRGEWLLNQSVSEGRPGAKVYFGARLIPRPDKFYELELVSDPRGVDTVKNTTTITSINNRPSTTTVTNSTTNDPQALAYTLQMGKRYGLVTLRGGIIESSGGVGADLHLLNESLQLSLSIFQFNRPQNNAFPRAKLWADYIFMRHFYVTTGVDDFLNRWRSLTRPGGRPFNIGTDVFFGAGLRFTDDDIKTLLISGAAGAAAGAAK